MTRRERVIAAVNHKETDFIPYHIDFTKQEHDRVAAFINDPGFEEKIGSHISQAYYDGYLTEIAPGTEFWKDDYGVIWNRNGADKDIGVIDGLLIEEPDMKLYKFPPIKEASLRKDYEDLCSSQDDTFKFATIGFSMFERAWTLRGMENFLVDMITEPEFADELLDEILAYNLKIIDIALEYGIDGFHFGDDWGQQKGLIMGPGYWKRFIKPRMAKMYERVKSKGKIVSQHSCGDISEIFPDLIDIGLDVYQTFQPEIYDIEKVKKEYGNHLTFWGGISTQRLLPFATPDEVKQRTKEIMKIMGRNGGYIAAPTHSVPGDIPPENIIALIEAFKGQ
jgi:uroporphyrinogen decarboxylase